MSRECYNIHLHAFHEIRDGERLAVTVQHANKIRHRNHGFAVEISNHNLVLERHAKLVPLEIAQPLQYDFADIEADYQQYLKDNAPEEPPPKEPASKGVEKQEEIKGEALAVTPKGKESKTAKPKGKRFLWIGIILALVAAIVVAILLLTGKPKESNEEEQPPMKENIEKVEEKTEKVQEQMEKLEGKTAQEEQQPENKPM